MEVCGDVDVGVGVGAGGGGRGGGVEGRKDDAGTVEQREFIIEFDFAHDGRDACFGADRTRAAACAGAGAAAVPVALAQERVNDGGLADVGEADDADGDGALEVLGRGVGFEGAQEGVGRRFARQRFMVEDPGVGGRGAGAEGEGGEGASEVDEPGLEHRRGHEVDLVEDQDEALGAAGDGGDVPLCRDGARAGRVAGVEDVEEDVGGGEHGVECFVEGAAGGVFDGGD